MKNQDVLHVENVKMEHFIFFTSGGGRRQDYAGVQKRYWMTLGRKSAPASDFPLKSKERVCWAQHPGVHQHNGFPSSWVDTRNQPSHSGMRMKSP